jgi:PS-10 peptidase S37
MKIRLSHVVLLAFFVSDFSSFAQTVLNDKLIKYPQLEVRHVDNPFFKEYFEVYIDQPINHDDPKSETFKQRFCVGYNGLDVPNIMELDGYAIDYAARKGHVDELSKTFKCNLVVVEHRYFGKSVPKNMDWKYLTIKQAADDVHAIKIILETMMKGKWLVTGTSKGGQTALAYRMYYPKDVEGALLFGTPVRKEFTDKRLNDYFARVLKTPCGKEVLAYQKALLENKRSLLPLFDKFAQEKNITFGDKSIETIYDHTVLYYQFCFFQMCGKCEQIPTDTTSYKLFIKSLFDIVPPRFFSYENKQRSEASFYMFYKELGNFEYDLKPFGKLLREKTYSTSIFCPKGVDVKFDNTYLKALNTYMSKSVEKTIFVYGEDDPWASLQPEIKGKRDTYKYIIKDACHKTKVADMKEDQRKELYKTLSEWLAFTLPAEEK